MNQFTGVSICQSLVEPGEMEGYSINNPLQIINIHHSCSTRLFALFGYCCVVLTIFCFEKSNPFPLFNQNLKRATIRTFRAYRIRSTYKIHILVCLFVFLPLSFTYFSVLTYFFWNSGQFLSLNVYVEQPDFTFPMPAFVMPWFFFCQFTLFQFFKSNNFCLRIFIFDYIYKLIFV